MVPIQYDQYNSPAKIREVRESRRSFLEKRLADFDQKVDSIFKEEQPSSRLLMSEDNQDEESYDIEDMRLMLDEVKKRGEFFRKMQGSEMQIIESESE